MPPYQTNLISDLAAASVKQAAGPPIVSTPSASSLLKRYWRLFQQRRQRERSRVSLQELSDRTLKDIGVTSGDLDRIAAQRTFERLKHGATYFWPPHGLM